MNKFEYKVVKFTRRYLKSENLNIEFGNKGWEMVSIMNFEAGKYIILKRLVSEFTPECPECGDVEEFEFNLFNN